jgi:hypothetical protein
MTGGVEREAANLTGRGENAPDASVADPASSKLEAEVINLFPERSNPPGRHA